MPSMTIVENMAGVNVINTSKVYSSGAVVSISESVADSVTDQLHALVVDVTQIKAVFIHADVAMTVEFNDSGTGVPTIVLVANVPYLWTTDFYYTNLLTTDITKVYVTNASGSAGTFKFEVIVDPTV